MQRKIHRTNIRRKHGNLLKNTDLLHANDREHQDESMDMQILEQHSKIASSEAFRRYGVDEILQNTVLELTCEISQK